jgi:RNA polymerase sigma factor (sigma-70 family)
MPPNELIPHYIQRLKRQLRRVGRADADAEDLIQEAFIRLEMYKQTQEVREPEGFLVRAVANLSIDKHRHDSFLDMAGEPVDELPIFDSQPQPDEVYAARERLHTMIAGLEVLPERTQVIFVALRVDGKSYQDIARDEQISVSAVEKHIARAMLHLTEWMNEHDPD